MSKNAYNKKDLELIIYLLKDQINELEKWSVYNEDKYSEQIEKIKDIVKEL